MTYNNIVMGLQQMAKDRSDHADFIADLAEFAAAGVERALAARQRPNSLGFRGPIFIGFAGYPDWNNDMIVMPHDNGNGDNSVTIFQNAKRHNTIIEAVFKKAPALIKQLDTSGGKKSVFSSEEILNALAIITDSEEILEAIDYVADGRKKLGSSFDRMEKNAQAKIGKAMAEVRSARTIDKKIEVLKNLERKTSDEDIGMAVGLKTAIAIAELGKSSIYSQEFYREFFGTSEDGLNQAEIAAHGIASADFEGAVAGAVGGALAGAVAGGVGAGPGAVIGGAAGAIGESAGAAAGMLLDWIFG